MAPYPTPVGQGFQSSDFPADGRRRSKNLVSYRAISSPAGRKRIAQRFNAGLRARGRNQVPSGTTERTLRGGRFLSSLRDLPLTWAPNPALKRWAIVERPSGTEMRLCQTWFALSWRIGFVPSFIACRDWNLESGRRWPP